MLLAGRMKDSRIRLVPDPLPAVPFLVRAIQQKADKGRFMAMCGQALVAAIGGFYDVNAWIVSLDKNFPEKLSWTERLSSDFVACLTRSTPHPGYIPKTFNCPRIP